VTLIAAYLKESLSDVRRSGQVVAAAQVFISRCKLDYLGSQATACTNREREAFDSSLAASKSASEFAGTEALTRRSSRRRAKRSSSAEEPSSLLVEDDVAPGGVGTTGEAQRVAQAGPAR